MADSTDIYSLPYLELGDAPDIASGLEDLAEAVEDELERIDGRIDTINGVSTASGTQNTTQSSYSSTTFTAGTNQCTAAFTAPPSGSVVMFWKAYFQAAKNDLMALVGCELRTGSTPGSGSVVVAANSNDVIAIAGHVEGGEPMRLKACQFKLVTGLTPGNSYHARIMYNTESGGNITVFTREVIVMPML
jgi:hypothetical protein